MGYKIDYYRFIEFQMDIEDLLGKMLDDLEMLKIIETLIMDSQAVQCKAMDCVNRYIQDKHLGIVVPAIETAITNFMLAENIYFMEMYEIEEENGSIIEEDTLEELITTLTTLDTSVTEFINEINEKAKAVSDIVVLETKSEEDFQNTMDVLISKVSTLKAEFEEYEINKLAEAMGSEWVVNGAASAVDAIVHDTTEITEYQPEVNFEMEVPEFVLRSSSFIDEFGYTEERINSVLETRDTQWKLYAKEKEGQRLKKYFRNLVIAGVSMLIPFGNKFKGIKLISEGISLLGGAYSADRYCKGCQLLEQVRVNDVESEATGLFDLENKKYGNAIIAMGEVSNLYTSVLTTNAVFSTVFGTEITFVSTLGDCGEEVITAKATDMVYNITDENEMAALFVGGYIGNSTRRGISLGLKSLDDVMLGGKISGKVDFNNAGNFDTINGKQSYVVENSSIDVVWRENISGGGTSTFQYEEVKTFTAEETNQWFIDNVKPDYKPPYKLETIVKEIELTENTTFVRVYDNMPDGSGMYGSWVMKAEDIEGLTPLEIQNKFALPNTPKYVCDVELEAGTHIRVGEVNPLDGWGSGGGTQYDLIGQRIGDFKNERFLEGN